MNLPIPYPDREQVVIDILQALRLPSDAVTPVPVGTWLPPDWAPPWAQVQRIGGGPDPWDVTDYALMRVSYYGATRGDAWALSQAGESLILGHDKRAIDRPGTPSHEMLVDHTSLDVGGSMDPDLEPDDRRVTVNYTVGMRRQRHLVGA